jgi:predicted Na+-dependent transporter
MWPVIDRFFLNRIMAILTAISTINMGAGLDLKIVRRNFIRPIGPVVGFFSQFGFMPPVKIFNL